MFDTVDLFSGIRGLDEYNQHIPESRNAVKIKELEEELTKAVALIKTLEARVSSLEAQLQQPTTQKNVRFYTKIYKHKTHADMFRVVHSSGHRMASYEETARYEGFTVCISNIKEPIHFRPVAAIYELITDDMKFNGRVITCTHTQLMDLLKKLDELRRAKN